MSDYVKPVFLLFLIIIAAGIAGGISDLMAITER